MRWMLHGNPKCEIHIIAMTWLTTTLTHEQIKLEYYRKAICTNDGAVDKVRSRSLTWTRYIHASHIDQHCGAFWFPGTSIINHLVNNHFHCNMQTLFVLYFPFDDIKELILFLHQMSFESDNSAYCWIYRSISIINSN